MPPGAGDGSRFDTGRQDVTETGIERCLQCGGPRGPGRKMYCSHKCGDDAYRDRVRAASANNVTSCQRCGAPIQLGSRRPRLYCSGTCRVAALRVRGERPAVQDWIPEAGTRSGDAPVQRRRLIRAWAEQGYNSRQMSERLGMRDDVIRRIAREMGFTIPADELVNRSRRHDSALIIRETVQALEALVMGMSLVSLDDPIDPAEAKAWATSLTGSLRVLSQFANQIKEMTQ